MCNGVKGIKVPLYYYNIMEKKTDLESLKKKLEKEGEEKIQKLYDDNKNISKLEVIDKKIDNIVQIMKDGEKEFIEKMGRHMTMSEIRELYG
jgi:hypothetical protein